MPKQDIKTITHINPGYTKEAIKSMYTIQHGKPENIISKYKITHCSKQSNDSWKKAISKISGFFFIQPYLVINQIQ